MIRDKKSIVFETKEELTSVIVLLEVFYKQFEKARNLTEKDINIEMVTNLLELRNELKFMNRTEF